MPQSLFDLTGMTALITGSSQGLGFEIARGLGKAGATVILNGRNKAKLDLAVDHFKRLHIAVHGVTMDVRDEGAVSKTISGIEKDIGPINILLNNAGIQRRGNLEDIDQKTWQEVIDTNLTAAFLVSKHVAKRMIGRNRGKIINICSVMSELGRQTTGPYTAAKGGLKMLTRAMAVEWACYNIQTNGIGPGYFLTEMTKPLANDQTFDGWVKGRTPARRWGVPEELIGTAVYLASEASNFVNGQIIYVDGGMTISL